MSAIKAIGPNCTLGEGPLWHPKRERLFWFDIIKGDLFSCNAYGEQLRHWNFGEAASAAGWLDDETLVVATESGLQRFDCLNGTWETIAELEADNKQTRSNDGRVGPDGSFWIGTMGWNLEKDAGAYYRVLRGDVQPLASPISIPNATCFSPDGRMAYLADTPLQLIWRWSLDENGNPVGEREVHIDLRSEGLNPDGAVCDAEGYLWNAQWGASRVARYAPDGAFVSAIEFPATQITCPAFGGEDLKTLYVTSAAEGLSEDKLEAEPDAGKVFIVDVDVPGIPEHQIKIQ